MIDEFCFKYNIIKQFTLSEYSTGTISLALITFKAGPYFVPVATSTQSQLVHSTYSLSLSKKRKTKGI